MVFHIYLLYIFLWHLCTSFWWALPDLCRWCPVRLIWSFDRPVNGRASMPSNGTKASLRYCEFELTTCRDCIKHLYICELYCHIQVQICLDNKTALPNQSRSLLVSGTVIKSINGQHKTCASSFTVDVDDGIPVSGRLCCCCFVISDIFGLLVVVVVVVVFYCYCSRCRYCLECQLSGPIWYCHNK